MKILDDIHLNASKEFGYILNLQAKRPLDLQPFCSIPAPTAGGTGWYCRGGCACRAKCAVRCIIYLPLPKLAIVYKYRPVELRVGITKGFPQSPNCSLVSLVDWAPSCPAMVSPLGCMCEFFFWILIFFFYQSLSVVCVFEITLLWFTYLEK